MSWQQKVLDFLDKTEGSYVDLKNYVKEHELHGPIKLKVSDVTPTVGPGHLNNEPLEEFESRVAKRIAEIRSGKQPFPLLTELHEGKHLLLDGNHTLAALKKIGVEECEVIYFEDHIVHDKVAKEGAI